MKTFRPRPARPFSRRLRDAVLLPFALVLVLFETTLQGIARLVRHFGPLRRLEAQLARLPPWAILPLFLIPEAMDHAGGFYATYLLAQRQYLAATLVAVLIKGVGLVIALWIYQACRPALMTIGWFARLHGKVEAARDWAMLRIRPSLDRARAVMHEMRGALPFQTRELGAAHSRRRFAAIRLWLRMRLGVGR